MDPTTEINKYFQGAAEEIRKETDRCPECGKETIFQFCSYDCEFIYKKRTSEEYAPSVMPVDQRPTKTMADKIRALEDYHIIRLSNMTAEQIDAEYNDRIGVI